MEQPVRGKKGPRRNRSIDCRFGVNFWPKIVTERGGSRILIESLTSTCQRGLDVELSTVGACGCEKP